MTNREKLLGELAAMSDAELARKLAEIIFSHLTVVMCDDCKLWTHEAGRLCPCEGPDGEDDDARCLKVEDWLGMECRRKAVLA